MTCLAWAPSEELRLHLTFTYFSSQENSFNSPSHIINAWSRFLISPIIDYIDLHKPLIVFSLSALSSKYFESDEINFVHCFLGLLLFFIIVFRIANKNYNNQNNDPTNTWILLFFSSLNITNTFNRGRSTEHKIGGGQYSVGFEPHTYTSEDRDISLPAMPLQYAHYQWPDD